MIKNEENFKNVIDNIFKPIVEKHKEDIEKILDNDFEMQERVYTKVQIIMNNRKKKKIKYYEKLLSITKHSVRRKKIIKKIENIKKNN